MSVKTQIERITQNIANAYAVLKALGCDMPEEQTSDNLSTTAGTSKVLKYEAQSLTSAQKTQARSNIGASSQDDLNKFGGTVEVTNGNPTKANTVLTVDPSAEEVTIYTADEVDSMMEDLTVLGKTPSYVKTESDEVISKIINKQGNRTFTFAVITDMHYGSGNYMDGIKHAGQAIKYIRDRFPLDGVFMLGDNTDSYAHSSLQEWLNDVMAVNRFIDTDLNVQGNHDFHKQHSPLVARLVASNNKDVVYGSRLGGYFYRDYEDYKLRVIGLNTSETNGSNMCSSKEQYEWFINTLDLSSKSDVEEWQTLIISHMPLDWYDSNFGYAYAHILDAYTKGTSWSGSGLSCDFTNKNKAVLVGNIHGHIHNFLVDKIYIGNPENTTQGQTSVWRMAMPNSRIDAPNHYSPSVWREATTYTKTENTANDTAFCVCCLDLDTYTIDAICYGAGYDRTLKYAEGVYTPSEPDEPDTPSNPTTYTNILDIYPVTLNARWSASGKNHQVCNGMIEFAVPWSVIKDKTVRFKGFPGDITASNNSAQVIWVDSSATKVDTMFWYKPDGSSYYNSNIWQSNGVTEADGVYAYEFIESNISGHGFSTIETVHFSMPIKNAVLTEADIKDLIVTVDEPITNNGGNTASYTNLRDKYLVGRDIRFSSTNGSPWTKECNGAALFAIPFADMMEKTLRIKSPSVDDFTPDNRETQFSAISDTNTFNGYIFAEGNGNLHAVSCRVNEGNDTYSFLFNDANVNCPYVSTSTMYMHIIVNTTGTAITDEEFEQVVITIDEEIK